MCVVSLVSDHYMNRFGGGMGGTGIQNLGLTATYSVQREEFESLKKDVLEMKELLKRAKAYDERTGQPDCELKEKIEMLKKIAERFGVSLDDVFGKSQK